MQSAEQYVTGMPPVVVAGDRVVSAPDLDIQSIGSRLADWLLQLNSNAVPLRGGAKSWMIPQDDLADSSGSTVMGPQVYTGTSGIALFCGAYYLATGNLEARELALHVVAPLSAKMRELAHASGTPRPLAISVGGLTGLGGFLYTFTRLAVWLDSSELHDSALAVCKLFTPDRIWADQKFDIVKGTAGALLSLLAFEKTLTSAGPMRQHALDMAVLCGEYLLRSRAPQGTGLRAWPGALGPAITGFAHGAAGIAYALVRLYERTGNEELRKGVREAFDFERSLYDPFRKTWFDPRFNRFLEHTAWCHGAPGIALARLGALSVVDSEAIRSDIQDALAITRALPLVHGDDLCCGNFGRVDILHTAAQVLGQADCLEHACSLANQVLTRAAISGFCFGPPNGMNDHTAEFRPSLFRGLTGVGYVLLRLIYPTLLPSILLLE